MRVLHIHERDLMPDALGHLDPGASVCGERGGGLAVYLAEVVEAQQKRGHDVATVSLSPGAAGREDLAPGHHRLKGFRFRYSADTVRALADIVAEHDPDVVHLHSLFREMHPHMLEPLVRERTVVCTFHDVRALCFRSTKLHRNGSACDKAVGVRCVTSGCYRPGENASLPADMLRVLLHERQMQHYRELHRIIVPSGYMKRVLMENGFDDSLVAVAPLFSRFAPRFPGATPPGPLRLLFVGRLDHGKGVEPFIESLSHLRSQDWQATIVGDGPCEARARAMVAQQGLTSRVTFAGVANGEALAVAYRGCDAVVFSSLMPESFGLVGVEAMSFGRPVVAFDAGGVTEWLEDGETGLLARYGDVRHLAAQMRRLLADRDYARRLGETAYQRVCARFTLEHHVDSLMRHYHELTDSPVAEEVCHG